MIEWVENGGLLLRFAGPRLAASDTARSGEEPADAGAPAHWRAQHRRRHELGRAQDAGALCRELALLRARGAGARWSISSQVVAQPDPQLSERVIAELADGTPLVTRKTLGQGQVVLFHVTANAEWSSLPLSGLFVSMLERLAVSSSAAQLKAEDLEGTTWTPVEVLDGFGRLEAAETLPGVDGPDLVAASSRASPKEKGSGTGTMQTTTENSTPAEANWPRILRDSRTVASSLPDLLVEARRIAVTVAAGWHGRRQPGPGESFWQFRPFTAGEPATRVDWRRSARDDHLYVRELEWEAAHTVWMWADLSASMGFRSDLSTVVKRDRALVLLLALSRPSGRIRRAHRSSRSHPADRQPQRRRTCRLVDQPFRRADRPARHLRRQAFL